MRHPKILSKGFLSVIIVIISYLFVNSSSYAQTTGSIGGTVIDANDNTPLEGAIVRIVGTNKATQTNENGQYVLINVDVGTYSVQADYIGYDSIIVQNIKVSVDKVAEVNFRMGEKNILVIEGGTITAQRSALDVTQTGSIVTGEQIENRGTRGIQNIAAQTSGVVTDERGQNINVRGLRSNENQVIIDGVSTKSVATFVPDNLA